MTRLARSLPLLLAATATLAACDRQDHATSFSIDAEGGNVSGTMNGNTGEVALNVPGFQGSLKLPKIQLDADKLDLNGVRLYPGSTVQTVNVEDQNGGGAVKVAFTSPAAPAAVRDWFGPRLAKAGYTLRPTPSGLAGKTDTGKPFRMDLAAQGSDRTSGTMVIGG